jgi:hypothetical protein
MERAFINAVKKSGQITNITPTAIARFTEEQSATILAKRKGEFQNA